MVFFTEEDIDRIINDDVPVGDMTSLLLDFSGQEGQIKLFARNPMVVCCSEEAERIYKKVGLTVKQVTPSGTFIQPGDLIIEAEGKVDAIHLIWRTGGAMLEFASSIATRTRTLIEDAKRENTKASVAGTRKHPPLLKKMALKALMAGGGVPHRTGLSDTILIFKEHLAFKGGYNNISSVIDQIKAKQKERKIVVEAHTLEQGIMAVKAGADAIQFDKLSPDDFKEAAIKCRDLNSNIVVIAAGGVNGKNITSYSKAGADVLVTSWMYFGPPADIKAEINAIA